MVMPGWWLSWYNGPPIADFELHSPWWVSGFSADGAESIVAAVRAESEDAARDQVRLAYDHPPAPEDMRWRFCEPLERETPFSDRFPQHPWMAWDEQGTCMCSMKHGGPR